MIVTGTGDFPVSVTFNSTISWKVKKLLPLTCLAYLCRPSTKHFCRRHIEMTSILMGACIILNTNIICIAQNVTCNIGVAVVSNIN